MKNSCPVCKESGLYTTNMRGDHKRVSDHLGWHSYCKKCNIYYDDNEQIYTKFFNKQLFQVVHRGTSIIIIKYDSQDSLMFGNLIHTFSNNENYIFNFSEKKFLSFIRIHGLLQ
jgi:hypothetical protein